MIAIRQSDWAVLPKELQHHDYLEGDTSGFMIMNLSPENLFFGMKYLILGDEYLGYRFIGVGPDVHKITVREGTKQFEQYGHGCVEVPNVHKLGHLITTGPKKYKYTLTEQDRELAKQLWEKLEHFDEFAEIYT